MYRILSVSLVLCLAPTSLVLAHQAACHRQHSCPADPDAYICGDLGYCTACPDNQYCRNRLPRRTAATQRPALRPAPAQASTSKQAKPVTARASHAQPAQRQHGVQRQPAAHATPTAHSKEQSPHAQTDDTQRQWDAYEQQLQTYCTQVAPTAVRQCMHGELARQDTEQARQRAKKYAPARASR